MRAAIYEKYHVFATSMISCKALKEIDHLPDEYRKRWGIETGYRQVNEIRPRTTSRDATFRMILFYTALLMYNMWAVHCTELPV